MQEQERLESLQDPDDLYTKILSLPDGGIAPYLRTPISTASIVAVAVLTGLRRGDKSLTWADVIHHLASEEPSPIFSLTLTIWLNYLVNNCFLGAHTHSGAPISSIEQAYAYYTQYIAHALRLIIAKKITSSVNHTPLIEALLEYASLIWHFNRIKTEDRADPILRTETLLGNLLVERINKLLANQPEMNDKIGICIILHACSMNINMDTYTLYPHTPHTGVNFTTLSQFLGFPKERDISQA